MRECYKRLAPNRKIDYFSLFFKHFSEEDSSTSHCSVINTVPIAMYTYKPIPTQPKGIFCSLNCNVERVISVCSCFWISIR
uniref:Uncharacterized protein n=1 Tax=Trichogramma kaykai TaxID=54128 RepID=A0ABD2X3U4_9HYME